MKFTTFDELLSKQMTRREFLLHLFLLAITVTGISTLLKTISNPHLINRDTEQHSGFGSGPYGK